MFPSLFPVVCACSKKKCRLNNFIFYDMHILLTCMYVGDDHGACMCERGCVHDAI